MSMLSRQKASEVYSSDSDGAFSWGCGWCGKYTYPTGHQSSKNGSSVTSNRYRKPSTRRLRWIPQYTPPMGKEFTRNVYKSEGTVAHNAAYRPVLPEYLLKSKWPEQMKTEPRFLETGNAGVAVSELAGIDSRNGLFAPRARYMTTFQHSQNTRNDVFVADTKLHDLDLEPDQYEIDINYIDYTKHKPWEISSESFYPSTPLTDYIEPENPKLSRASYNNDKKIFESRDKNCQAPGQWPENAVTEKNSFSTSYYSAVTGIHSHCEDGCECGCSRLSSNQPEGVYLSHLPSLKNYGRQQPIIMSRLPPNLDLGANTSMPCCQRLEKWPGCHVEYKEYHPDTWASVIPELAVSVPEPACADAAKDCRKVKQISRMTQTSNKDWNITRAACKELSCEDDAAIIQDGDSEKENLTSRKKPNNDVGPLKSHAAGSVKADCRYRRKSSQIKLRKCDTFNIASSDEADDIEETIVDDSDNEWALISGAAPITEVVKLGNLFKHPRKAFSLHYRLPKDPYYISLLSVYRNAHSDSEMNTCRSHVLRHSLLKANLDSNWKRFQSVCIAHQDIPKCKILCTFKPPKLDNRPYELTRARG